MPFSPPSAPRLYLAADLAADRPVPLERAHINYLVNVLRLSAGEAVHAFNGRDGEWACVIVQAGRKDIVLKPERQLRPQTPPGDLHYLFAPLKHARLDYMAQKATEMGASRLAPVITHRTQASRVNLERLQANAIEAAEQCGLLTIPAVAPERKLPAALAALEPARWLIFCDEDEADQASGGPLEALSALAGPPIPPLAVLIGPEGGFDDVERALILRRPHTLRLGLGPRILRADTAAVAALAIVQASLGDWRAAGMAALREDNTKSSA
jgi:16S rRNA (uracil1498-N3)-methyltransferase